MKKQLFIYSLLMALLVLLSPASLIAQQWYYFNGYVTDIDDGSPVTEHAVFLTEGDSLFVQISYTNDYGYYSDSIFLYGQGDKTVIIGTFDCLGKEHLFLYDDPDSTNNHSFEVCTQFSGCFAYFYIEADQQDPLLVHFMDFSEGDIETWAWDFGDGEFSSEQNPSHHYQTEGFYEVCLTVENESDTCLDQYCEMIFVGQNNCLADFNWDPSFENPLEIDFTDLSYGNIVFWQWDFGDGSYSDQQSPVHQYTEAGEYWVNLYVSDSMGFCYDETWQLVNVFEDTSACNAAFNYTLDTLNNTPFVYYFEDKSEGNINQWHWEFGDGQSSNERNPQHIYEKGGTYDVCLTISSTQASKGDCFDQVCHTLEMPDYFNFGGQVFIDGFTINIDSNDNANIATAYLYRRFDNQWRYMDQREFWKYGYYWFANKPEGEYLVRADLLEGSIDYNSFAPSYYKEAVNWQYANTFFLSNDEEFAVNIDLKKLATLHSGIGSLSGYLEPGIGCSYSIELENQLVYLLNAEHQIVAFTYTIEDGYFSFTGLAFETYRVKAEFTGNSSTYFEAILNAEQPAISNIDLIIDCNSFVGVDEYISENSLTLESIYPVPATNFVTLNVSASRNIDVSIIIYDLNAQVVYQKNTNLNQGRQQLNIGLSSLRSGMYLLKLVSADGKSTINQKLIINN